MERLPSRGQTVRFPRLSRYSRGLLRSPRPSAGLRSLARDPLAAAGSLTPSGVRLKAPAAPGLFRGDGEITVKGSKCQGWGISSASKGMGVRKQAQISPPPFFLRLSPVGGSGWKPSTAKVSEVEPNPRKQEGGCAQAGTNFPTAFFFCGCRLSAAAAGSHPPQRQQNPPPPQVFSCSGSSRRRQNPPPPQAFGCSGSSQRRQNPPPPQVFSCSGSSSSDGKIHRRRRCSAVRAAAADGKIHRRRQNPPPPQVFSCSGTDMFYVRVSR